MVLDATRLADIDFVVAVNGAEVAVDEHLEPAPTAARSLGALVALTFHVSPGAWRHAGLHRALV